VLWQVKITGEGFSSAVEGHHAPRLCALTEVPTVREAKPIQVGLRRASSRIIFFCVSVFCHRSIKATPESCTS